MGWKSTLDISRQQAIDMIEKVDLEDLSNEDLAEVLEAIMPEDHGYNYRVMEGL